MSTVQCAGCDTTGQGELVHYIAQTKRGPQSCTSLRPPEGWGVRSLDNGQSTVMFCDECRGKMARGEMKV